MLYAQNKEGKDLINTIGVRSDTVDAGGAKVGQTLSDVRKVYGDPSSDDETVLSYEKNGTELQFITDESGKVVLIPYTHPVDEE